MTRTVNTSQMILMLCEAYGRRYTEATEFAYTMALDNLGIEDWRPHVTRLLNSFNSMPTPKQVIDLIKGPEASTREKAVQLSNQILKAVSRFGYVNKEEALQHLGPVGKHAVRMAGGWERVCNLNTNDAARMAQLRDTCESVIGMSEGRNYDSLQLNDTETKQFLNELSRRRDLKQLTTGETDV